MRLIFLLVCLFMFPSRGEASCTVEAALNHPITAITLDMCEKHNKICKTGKLRIPVIYNRYSRRKPPCYQEYNSGNFKFPLPCFVTGKPFRWSGNQRRSYYFTVLSYPMAPLKEQIWGRLPP